MGVSDPNYFSHDRPEVVELVPAGASIVLDVGCGAGAVGAAIKRGGRKVVGIEQHPAASAQAAKVLDAVNPVDLNDSVALRAFVAEYEDQFDCVVAADVLEHLYDPWHVLSELVRTLRDGGSVVISLPNVRVLSVLVPLVFRGRFEYRDRGVLDRTHLRFFTRASAQRMVEDAGLRLVTVDRADTPWRRGWKAWLGGLVGDLGNEQFLLVAVRDA